MKSMKYAFEKDGEKRLEITWKGIWKEINVIVDGEVIGVIDNFKELKAGREFRLKDSSKLTVKYSNTYMNQGLLVLKDDEPLPGSAGNPETILKFATGLVFFVGILNVVLGVIAELFKVEILINNGIGIGSIILGAIYLVLGFFVMKKSAVALIIAIAVFALDGILSLYFIYAEGGKMNTSGIIVRVFLIIPMIQGVNAIFKMKGQSKNVQETGAENLEE